MRGICVKPVKATWRGVAGSGESTFACFFQPILPELAGFHWVYPDTLPFVGGGREDIEFERLTETVCAEGYIPPDTLLPRYANCVTNDWAELYGFLKRPDAAAVRRQLQRGHVDYEWLGGIIDICFFNVDGVWWEIYARAEGLLLQVKQHALKLPDVSVEERVLAEREAFLRSG